VLISITACDKVEIQGTMLVDSNDHFIKGVKAESALCANIKWVIAFATDGS